MIRTDEITRLNDDGTPSSDLRSWRTAYEYDPNDRLTRITDSQGNVKTMAYDGLKRKTAQEKRLVVSVPGSLKVKNHVFS